MTPDSQLLAHLIAQAEAAQFPPAPEPAIAIEAAPGLDAALAALHTPPAPSLLQKLLRNAPPAPHPALLAFLDDIRHARIPAAPHAFTEAPGGGFCRFPTPIPALNPPCPDSTGLALQSLPPNHPSIPKALDFLRQSQNAEGAWPARWATGHIFSTMAVLGGLRAIDYDPREAEVLRASEWLRSVQNADGGWGESPQGPDASNPTHSAWALLALLDSGDTTSQSVLDAAHYLAKTNSPTLVQTYVALPGLLTYSLAADAAAFPRLALAEFLRLVKPQ